MKIIVNISTLRWSMMKIRSFSHFVHNNVKIIAKMDDFNITSKKNELAE